MLVTLTVLPSCSGSSEPVAVQPPDLKGSWVLNAAESEDPRAQMRGRSRGVGRGGGRGGGGGGSRGGGRGGRGGGMGGTDQMLGGAMEAARVLKITQDDSTVTIVDADQNRRVLYPDGRTIEREVRGGRKFETKTRWKGEKLVVERKTDGGAKITETFERKEDGRLHVKVKVSGGRMRGSLEVRRVYDLVKLDP